VLGFVERRAASAGTRFGLLDLRAQAGFAIALWADTPTPFRMDSGSPEVI
jgi:hypothetical protein